MKTVSVLVPVYNVENYIERCIRSIFNQTYDDLEIIIVDDCSPDNSILIAKRILDEFPKRQEHTKIVHHEHNKGLAATRNTGLDYATGDYVMFVDSDDWLETNTIEECMNIVQHYKSDIIVFNSIHVFNNFKKVSPFYSYSTKEEYIYNIISRKCPVNVWGKLYKRKIFDNSNSRFIPGLNNGEDYVTLPRIVYFADSVHFLNKNFYYYNKVNESSFGLNYKIEYAYQVIRAVDILNDFFYNLDDGKYNKAIDVAKLMIKSGLIQRAYTNSKFTDKRTEFILLYQDVELQRAIPLFDKVVLYYCKKKQYRILNIICKLRFKLSQFIKGNI